MCRVFLSELEVVETPSDLAKCFLFNVRLIVNHLQLEVDVSSCDMCTVEE